VITRAAAAAALTAVLVAAPGCTNDNTSTGQSIPSASPTGLQGTPPGTPGTTAPVTPEPIPPGDPTKAPAGGLPRPSQVNSADPTAVAVTVAAVTFRYDTAIDNSPSDAHRRTKPWLADTLARQVDGGQVAAPGAEWSTWVQHRAYTTSTAVDATEDGAPQDTATRADRTISVTVQPVGRDRWRGAAQQYALFITLTRPSTTAPWKVSQLQVQE
jgi:hypothetical protein